MYESPIFYTIHVSINSIATMALWAPVFPEPIRFYLTTLIVTLPLLFIGALFTLGLHYLIQHAPIPGIRLLLPPIVTALLIGIQAFLVPAFSQTRNLLLGILILFVLPTTFIAMEVLTPWPAVQGRLKYVRRTTVVFLCATGSFYLTMLFDSGHWAFMGSEMTTPFATILTTSSFLTVMPTVVSSVGIYLRGVLIAACWYLVLLLFDSVLVHIDGHREQARDDRS